MAIALGNEFTLVLTERGKLYAFGSNSNGKLGIGNFTDQNTPVCLDTEQAFQNEHITMVAARYYHAACVTDNSDLWSWGSNMSGQSGAGRLRGQLGY